MSPCYSVVLQRNYRHRIVVTSDKAVQVEMLGAPFRRLVWMILAIISGTAFEHQTVANQTRVFMVAIGSGGSW